MTFTITLTPQDFAAANWLLVRKHWVRRWGPWIVLGVGLLFGAMLAFAAYQRHPEMAQDEIVGIFAKGMLFSVLFVGLQLGWLLIVILRAAKEAIGSGETKTFESAYEADESGLKVDGETFVWSAFTRVIEDPNYLLLCRTAATFFAFPRWQIDAATRQALIAGVKAGKGGPP